jgi:sugar O-acyltransferase (sialic acid O-acetyltransferase NeuD family)
MRKLVIIGAGGFGKEVAWVVERINEALPTFELAGFCDDAEARREGLWGAYAMLGRVESVRDTLGAVGFVCAIGNNRERQAMAARARAAGHHAVQVVDPSAVVAPDALLGEGCYVGIGSVVSTGARSGAGVIVNHHVCVGHDVVVDDFAQLCPGVCVSGGCSIGEGALLGTNAGTIPLKRIGAWATVGAGVVALRDLADGGSAVRLAAR